MRNISLGVAFGAVAAVSAFVNGYGFLVSLLAYTGIGLVVTILSACLETLVLEDQLDQDDLNEEIIFKFHRARSNGQ